MNLVLLDAAAGATAQQLPKQLPQPLPKHMFSKAVAPRPRRPLPKPIAAAKADAPKQHPMQQLPEPTAVPKRQGPKQIAKHVFSKAAASKAAGSKAAGIAAAAATLDGRCFEGMRQQKQEVNAMAGAPKASRYRSDMLNLLFVWAVLLKNQFDVKRVAMSAMRVTTGNLFQCGSNRQPPEPPNPKNRV